MTVNHKDMSKKKWIPVLDPEIPKVKITVIKKEQAQDKPTCPHCDSENVYGISRVVGYFSQINNWNNSKKEEFKKRQQGNYWSEQK